jgi:hypothetical protein
MAKSSSLNEGRERLNKVVRERQHGSDNRKLEGPAADPKDDWARKHAAKGVGPDAPQTAIPEKPSAHQQAQFMRELKAKMGENHGKHAQSYGKMVMQQPFKPGKSGGPKRSMWSRMTRGS